MRWLLASEAVTRIHRDTDRGSNGTGARTAGLGIRILLVDDHVLVRQGMRLLLETDPDLSVVGEVATADEARAVAARERPSLVLLDAAAGLELISELTVHNDDLRVLVVTGVNDVQQHREALRAGASGVVLKQQAGDVLLKAVRRVHAGEVWADRSTTALVLSDLRRGSGHRDPASHAARVESLTTREREIVTLVAQGNSTQRIADALCISDKTVRNHLASIYSKLQVSDRLELALYAVKHRLTNPAARKNA
jgi:DNA-binding NarL/FixJ family response regulator